MDDPDRATGSLKRELGTLESYAILVGILVGAGIFRVTSDATLATGPSVIVAHLVLAPIVLASSVPYLVFLSTPLGLKPGGEVLHIERTLGSRRLTFLSAWLKLISYLGAAAYLADALALNTLELLHPGAEHGALATRVVALALLAAFLLIHLIGVRWFGRLQVAMCAVLGVSLVILIVPGLTAIQMSNYRPFYTGGATGFARALPPLFFAYAGFEALSHAAGEVKDSRERLPRVFVRGILATTAIFVLMSIVALGVLPADELGTSGVPMSAAAATYLPFGGALCVTLGAMMAVATSLNATMLVPARLTWYLAHEGHVPKVLAQLHATRRTPVVGLLVSFGIVATLLISGRMGLALGIAIVALMLLYALHSVALICLPSRNPELYHQVTVRISRRWQLTSAWVSVIALSSLVLVSFGGDLARMLEGDTVDRLLSLDLTSLELVVLWVVLGLILSHRSRRANRAADATMGRD